MHNICIHIIYIYIIYIHDPLKPSAELIRDLQERGLGNTAYLAAQITKRPSYPEARTPNRQPRPDKANRGPACKEPGQHGIVEWSRVE